MLTVYATCAEWEAGPYTRLCEATNTASQIELAAFLEIRQSSVSDAKRRKSIPPEWLLIAWEKRGISPAWILTGKGCKYLVPTDDLYTIPTFEKVSLPHCHLCPLESMLTEMRSTMDRCIQIKSKLTGDKGDRLVVWYEDGKPISLYSLSGNEVGPNNPDLASAEPQVKTLE